LSGSIVLWVSSQRFKERIQLTRGRHEHIGKGYIGVEAFRLLLIDKRFWGLPMCLETPKGPDLKEDKENLTLLRSLVEG
jgi:deoxyribonuclease IV